VRRLAEQPHECAPHPFYTGKADFPRDLDWLAAALAVSQLRYAAARRTDSHEFATRALRES
jgi:hypothetical protein